MAGKPTPRITARKAPKQARASGLVAAVLDAAVQVLQSEGAARFTTARVAERAGVSVGSIYQYFPNKASILFRLQSDEWAETTELLKRILEERTRLPLERLRYLVQTFVLSEYDEANVRMALDDAAPLYRDAPEAAAAKATADAVMHDFMAEVLPDAPPAQRSLAADLIQTTMSQVGKSFSERPHTVTEIETFADAMADMFCAYLDRLAA